MSPLVAAKLAQADALRAQANAVEAEARALQAEPTETTSTPVDGFALADRRAAACALDVSLATIDRFVREGAPVETVGARRRFDLPALRTWLASRGRRPTKAAKRDEDPIDVSGIAMRAGLAGR